MIRNPPVAPFDALVDRWVTAAIAIGVDSTFAAIVRQLPGVYPARVFESLRRLEATGLVSTHRLSSLEAEVSRAPVPLTSPVVRGLPLPHPLEYEWRFTARTSLNFLTLAKDLCGKGESITLIGTPGVAAVAIRHPLDREVHFLGEDNSVTDALRHQNADADGPVAIATPNHARPIGKARVVVMDPPWYFDFIRSMLSTAAAECRFGGFVLLSLPSIGTRPSATEDRVRTVAFARRLGLELVEERSGNVVYSSPFFERNALAAAGFTNVPNDWRHGDLVILRKRRNVAVPPPTECTNQGRWTEIVVGASRVYVRREEGTSSHRVPTLEPVEGTGVLPSVSRRDPRRQMANVWSAGNRFFRCSRTDLLVEAAVGMGADVRNGDSRRRQRTVRECDKIREFASFLQGLDTIEAAEARYFGEGVSNWTHCRASNSRSSWQDSADTPSGNHI